MGLNTSKIRNALILKQFRLDGVFTHTTTIVESSTLIEAAGYWDSGCSLVLRDVNGSAACRDVSSFDAVNNRLTVAEAFPFTPVNGDAGFLIPTAGDVDVDVDAIKVVVDAIAADVIPTASGNRQSMIISVTIAADAAATTIATVSGSGSGIMLQDCVVIADAAPHSDLVSLNIKAGASEVNVLINDTEGATANLSATDKQVAWDHQGAELYLRSDATIKIDPTGSGSAPLDLTVLLIFAGVADGDTMA